MALISLAVAASSLGLALNFEGLKSAITGKRAAKPAGGGITRRKITTHYSAEKALTEDNEPGQRNDAALPISMQDREYWSYIAGLGTALPLVTVASPLAFPLAIGTGLVWFGFLPLLRNQRPV